MIQRNFLAVVFICVTALHLAPIWAVRYVPTADGPSHVYNAWVLQALVRGTAPPAVQSALAIRTRFIPNWVGHGLLALLIAVAGPLVGEKLFLTLLIAALSAAAWYLAGALGQRGQGAAFLILPVLVSWPMLMGFHGFCLGIALDLALLGYFARHAHGPGARVATVLAAGLLVALLLHPVSFAVGAAGIALLWVTDPAVRTSRSLARRLAALLPAVALGSLFLYTQRATLAFSPAPLIVRLRYLLEDYTVYTLFPGQVVLGRIAGALAAALVVVAASERPRLADRRTAPFLVLALCLGLVYLVSPEAAMGGSLLGPRLALYPALALMPWLAARLPLWAERTGAGLFGLWAVVHLGLLFPSYRAADREVAIYLEGLARVPAGASLRVDAEPLEPAGGRNIPLLLHAAGYVGAEKQLLLWPNYETGQTYFPIRLRAVHQGAPGAEGVVDYVYSWRLAPGSSARDRLEQDFDPVAASDAGGVLYQRKSTSAER